MRNRVVAGTSAKMSLKTPHPALRSLSLARATLPAASLTLRGGRDYSQRWASPSPREAVGREARRIAPSRVGGGPPLVAPLKIAAHALAGDLLTPMGTSPAMTPVPQGAR